MDIVFKIAQHIKVLSYGQVLAAGDAGRDQTQPGRHRRLSGHRPLRPAGGFLAMSRQASSRRRKDRRILRREPDLFDLDLSVGVGQIVALLGRNGAGKSTTFKAIAGIVPPKRGRIQLGKERIERPPAPPHRTRRHRLRAGGPAGLRRPERRGQSPDRREERTERKDAVDAGTHLRGLPDPCAACAHAIRTAVGRRAADADHRPHADGQSRSFCCSTSRARDWRRSWCSRSVS